MAQKGSLELKNDLAMVQQGSLGHCGLTGTEKGSLAMVQQGSLGHWAHLFSKETTFACAKISYWQLFGLLKAERGSQRLNKLTGA